MGFLSCSIGVEMKTPREFWIDMYAWTAHREEREVRPGNRICHVREVSPELDAAYLEAEKALEKIGEEFKRLLGGGDNDSELSERMEIAEIALAALRKARGDK